MDRAQRHANLYELGGALGGQSRAIRISYRRWIAGSLHGRLGSSRIYRCGRSRCPYAALPPRFISPRWPGRWRVDRSRCHARCRRDGERGLRAQRHAIRDRLRGALGGRVVGRIRGAAVERSVRQAPEHGAHAIEQPIDPREVRVGDAATDARDAKPGGQLAHAGGAAVEVGPVEPDALAALAEVERDALRGAAGLVGERLALGADARLERGDFFSASRETSSASNARISWVGRAPAIGTLARRPQAGARAEHVAGCSRHTGRSTARRHAAVARRARQQQEEAPVTEAEQQEMA